MVYLGIGFIITFNYDMTCNKEKPLGRFDRFFYVLLWGIALISYLWEGREKTVLNLKRKQKTR